MKRLNQRGDAALYILSVAVVIAIIGFAGWRVWKSMEDSKQSTNSSTQTSEQTPAEPVEDLGEQKVEGADLTFYYPVTQGPAAVAVPADTGGGTYPSRIAAYKFKDYVVEVNNANNTMLDLGLTGRVMCQYNINADTMTPESANQIPCEFEKETISGVAFYNTSTVSEVRHLPSFVAPTKDKKYVIHINHLTGSEYCQMGPPDAARQAKCEQARKDFVIELRADVKEFVTANPSLFK